MQILMSIRKIEPEITHQVMLDQEDMELNIKNTRVVPNHFIDLFIQNLFHIFTRHIELIKPLLLSVILTVDYLGYIY